MPSAEKPPERKGLVFSDYKSYIVPFLQTALFVFGLYIVMMWILYF